MKFKYGSIFLGKDERTYGKEGIGNIPYDPDYECGGPPGTPGRQCPFEPKQTLSIPDEDNHTLHIAIPSFRDPLCPRTLYYIFTKSAKPENIHVRVLQQNEVDDVDCLVEYCKMQREQNNNNSQGEECPFQNQIEIFPIKANEAHGPTTARSMLSKHIYEAHENDIVHPQDFCLSMDSHMDFEPHWDTSMKNMWRDAKNEYAVLSTYVEDRENLGRKNNAAGVPHLCMVMFTSNVRVHATKSASNLVKPKLTNAIWGAGLSYMKCHAELKVPVDPHTPGIFDGEEFNRAARFWTYGYDIYTPNFTYILHDYKRSQSNPKSHKWNSNKHNTKASEKRLLTLLEVPGGDYDKKTVQTLQRSKYGLGDRRSLDQLIQFSGVDLRHRGITIDGKNRCGNIQWVPFIEHSNGVDYIPNFDAKDEFPLDVPDERSVWYDGKDISNSVVKNNPEDVMLENLVNDNHVEQKVSDDPNNHSKQKEENLSSSSLLLSSQKKIAHRLPLIQSNNPPKKQYVAKEQKETYPNAIIPKEIRSLRINNSYFKQKQQHGIQHLPPLVRYVVVLLVVGMSITIIYTSRFSIMNFGNWKSSNKKKRRKSLKVRSL